MSDPARSRWRWSKAKSEAAALLADDELTAPQVAARLGISYRQLKRWREHPAFRAKVEALAEAHGEVTHRYAIANRHARLRALDERWQRLQQVIEERAAAPEMQAVPGGKAGLLVRRVRVVGSGKAAREVEEFGVDYGLLRELRECEKQAAQECGQWLTKAAQTKPDGTEEWQGPGFTQEEVEQIVRGLAARLGLAADAEDLGEQEAGSDSSYQVAC